MFLNRIGGHSAWVNSQALERAGIDQDTQDPPGGHVVRDEDGNATGMLLEQAEGGLVWDEANLAAFLAKPKDFMKGKIVLVVGNG